MALLTIAAADNVGFETTVTGTAAISVGAALAKHRAPPVGLDTGTTGLSVSYHMRHSDAGTEEWETGEGAFDHAAGTIQRTAGNVSAGSAGAGSLVNFSTGTKEVYVVPRAPDLGGLAASSHTHAAADIVSGAFADARVAQSNVTQHQAALSITESQISDLGAYLTDITAEPLSDLSDVTITSVAPGEILKWSGSAWVNNTLAEAGVAAASHTHGTADIQDNAVTLAKLAHGTAGKYIGFDGSGVPAELDGGGGTYTELTVSAQTGTTHSPATGNWYTYDNTGSITITLDDTLVDGGECVLEKLAGAGTITISPGASKTINGSGGSVVLFGKAHVKRIGTDYRVDGLTDGTDYLYSTLSCQNNVVQSPELRDISETSASQGSASGTITVDYSAGSVHEITLTGNMTSLTVNNPPASGKVGALTLIFKQDATGSRTATWPAAFVFPGGTDMVLSTAANAVDIVSFITINGGSTWYSVEVGKAFS